MLSYAVLLLSTCVICISPALLPSPEKILELTKLERNLLVFFNHYIEKQSHWITIIKWELKDLMKEVPVNVTRDDYLGHAINQFHLVRRLDRRWRRLLALANTTTVLNGVKVEFGDEIPDFEGYIDQTIKNILKIQKIYNFRIKSLASGYIGRDKSHMNLTADDCLTIGRHYFHNTLFFGDAWLWFNESLAKHGPMDLTTKSSLIKEYMFLSRCFKGDQKAAMAEYRSIIETEALFLPSDSLRQEYVLAFKGCQKAAEELQRTRKHWPMRMSFKEHENLSDPVCRGEVIEPPGLRCRLVTYGRRHLRIAPLKLEELHIDPPVVLFHDVITDEQAESIKRVSLRNLVPSSLETNEVALERSSETAVVQRDWEAFRLIRRVTEWHTGVSLTYSERPQVAAYGPGGEYAGHYDHLQRDFGPPGIKSNRLATFMIYIDDVNAGGHTGFPFLHIKVKPKKRSAVFWFNTFSDCTLDNLSLHNACPVALGTKTVVTQWILKAGNEFTWPCSLKERENFKYFYL